MKKIIYAFISFVFIIMLASCGKENVKPTISVTADKTELQYGDEANLNVVVKDSKNTEYSWNYQDKKLIYIENNILSVISDVEVETKTTIIVILKSDTSISSSLELTIKPTKKLETPQNVSISKTGLITWDKVSGATSYIVKINGNTNEVTDNFYQVGSIYNDFAYSVAAKAGDLISNFSDDLNFIGADPYENVSVAIEGQSEIRSGKSLSLKGIVNNAGDNNAVVWEIVKGSEYATITDGGVLKAKSVDSDKVIEVKATSVANSKKTASKIITIVSKPVLTQEMLDVLNSDKIGFEGYVNIALYTTGMFSTLYNTYVTAIKTAMNGTNWYGEYENTATGLTNGLYYKNYNDVACQVGVSFMNDEQFEPMLDENGKKVSWLDSGLYNGLKNLKLSDFTFDEDTWRYVYNGNDTNLTKRVIASANPYDFEPASNFGLIIGDGEILGIYAKSKDDYGVAAGYRAIQELVVAVSSSETVKVPTIAKFSHEDVHDKLNEAIANMQALDSYTLKYRATTASYYTNGLVQSGYVETVTQNDCYFVPFSVSYDASGNTIDTLKPNESYGYHKINDNLYNAYYTANDNFKASRAYETSFAAARPSFAFSGEIFRSYANDEEKGTTTYYVDEAMCSVASTFYYGVGNDENLYGVFATKASLSGNSSFTPYVVVKDGYIVCACFYFYIGSVYGIIEIEYSNFNSASLPSDKKIDFETRLVPTSYSELTIQDSTSSDNTSEDKEVNALEYFKNFFNDENIDEKLPFFGNVLGDTYGFGLTTVHITSKNQAKPAVVLYYDVPLGTDYTIDASLEAIYEYLESLGFERNKKNEFHKGDIWVAPTDSSLDLLIYIWRG